MSRHVKVPPYSCWMRATRLVFLDHAVLSEAAHNVGTRSQHGRAARAEPKAKRRYEAAMKRGVSHEAGWDLQMQAIYELAGLSAGRRPHGQPSAAKEAHDEFNLWRKVPGRPEAPH